MDLSPVIEAQVACVIKLKPKKLFDINKKSVWLLNFALSTFETTVSKLVNYLFKTGALPTELKLSKLFIFLKITIFFLSTMSDYQSCWSK